MKEEITRIVQEYLDMIKEEFKSERKSGNEYTIYPITLNDIFRKLSVNPKYVEKLLIDSVPQFERKKIFYTVMVEQFKKS